MMALTTAGVLARHDFHGEWNYTCTQPIISRDTPKTRRLNSSQAH